MKKNKRSGRAGESASASHSDPPDPSGRVAGESPIRAEGLSKFYGSFVAIQDVSFEIASGQIVAFLGPNGAGKSTTMKILTGYMAPSAGRAYLFGKDVAKHRTQVANRIGYLPENGPLYLDMTPLQFLNFMGSARGMAYADRVDRIGVVTEQCGLHTVLRKPIGKLSRGYRQRVGMAQVLLHDPDVLIMDEPTSGLDPNQIREVRETIRRIGKSKTILLSTHILQEVEAVADRVLFIDKGKIVANKTVAEFRGDGDMDARFAELTRSA